MIDITHADASAAILAACDAGTLVKYKWHGRNSEGREIACLLGSIHPSIWEPADCGGNLMPRWLAELVPTLFDGLPERAIIPVSRRFGEMVARWHVLADAQWDEIKIRFLVRCIDDALGYACPVCEGHDFWPPVFAASMRVRAALNGCG